jgi:Flp pilus assembly protein TadG
VTLSLGDAPPRIRRTRDDRERGSVTTEFAIVFPAVIILTLLLAQGALWYYARQSALAAAREGVKAARTYQSGPDAGVTRARETIGNLGGGVLSNPSVSQAGSTADRVRIEVTGDCVSLLPGIKCTVAQHAEAPIEKWTDPVP